MLRCIVNSLYVINIKLTVPCDINFPESLFDQLLPEVVHGPDDDPDEFVEVDLATAV